MSFQNSLFKQPLRHGIAASPSRRVTHAPSQQHDFTCCHLSRSTCYLPSRRPGSKIRLTCQATSSLAPALLAPHRGLSDSPRARVLASTDQLDPTSTAEDPSVTTLHSSQEFQDVVEQNPGKLVVLMCKARSCRPCKMFSRKFQRMAEQFQDAIFVDIMGDETNDTRRLMMKLDVRATPTFFLYRDGRVGNTLTGINENNLRNAIIEFGLPSDKDSAPLE